MTRVCLVGDDDVNLKYELLSRETARNALVTYDLREPFANTVGIETVSLGSAVALLNDLDWYLIRFVEDVLVLEPSISETEWLSRNLATAIRDDRIDVDDTGRFLKVYGVVDEETTGDTETTAEAGERMQADDAADAVGDDTGEKEKAADPSQERPPELVDPMLVARTGETIPEYDLRAVDETLLVRLTEAEFDA